MSDTITANIIAAEASRLLEIPCKVAFHAPDALGRRCLDIRIERGDPPQVEGVEVGLLSQADLILPMDVFMRRFIVPAVDMLRAVMPQ